MTLAAPIWRLRSFNALPSTSALCRDLAAQGEPAGLAVLARQQVSGRGRHGRIWESSPGNLSISLLLRPATMSATAGLWSLLAGVALAETMMPLLPDPSVLTLKWPNDVLLGGAKAAGILLEAAVLDGRVDWLVLGFGVNLASAPAMTDRQTSCLGHYAAPPPPEAFATALLDRLGHWATRFEQDGFEAVRQAWLACAPSIGTDTMIRLSDATWSGQFAGLAPDGSLILHTADGIRHFAAGEILLPAPAEA